MSQRGRSQKKGAGPKAGDGQSTSDLVPPNIIDKLGLTGKSDSEAAGGTPVANAAPLITIVNIYSGQSSAELGKGLPGTEVVAHLALFKELLRARFLGLVSKDSDPTLDAILKHKSDSWPAFARKLLNPKSEFNIPGEGKISFVKHCENCGVVPDEAFPVAGMCELIRQKGAGGSWTGVVGALKKVGPDDVLMGDLSGGLLSVRPALAIDQQVLGDGASLKTGAAAEAKAAEAKAAEAKAGKKPDATADFRPIVIVGISADLKPGLDDVNEALREAEAAGVRSPKSARVGLLKGIDGHVRKQSKEGFAGLARRIRGQTEIWVDAKSRIGEQILEGHGADLRNRILGCAVTDDFVQAKARVTGLSEAILCLQDLETKGLLKLNKEERAAKYCKIFSCNTEGLRSSTARWQACLDAWNAAPPEEREAKSNLRERLLAAENVADAEAIGSKFTPAKLPENMLPGPPPAPPKDHSADVVTSLTPAGTGIVAPDIKEIEEKLWMTEFRKVSPEGIVIAQNISFKLLENGIGVLAAKLEGLEIVVQVSKEELAKYETIEDAKAGLLLKDAPKTTGYNPVNNDYIRHLTNSPAFLVQRFVLDKPVDKIGLSLRCVAKAEISFEASNSVIRIEGTELQFTKLELSGSTTATLKCPKSGFKKYGFGRDVVVSGDLDDTNFELGRNESDMTGASLRNINVTNFGKSWKGTKFSFEKITENVFKKDLVKKFEDYDGFKTSLNIKAFTNVYSDPKAVSSMLQSMGVSVGTEGTASPDMVAALPTVAPTGTTFSFIEATLPDVPTGGEMGSVFLLLPSMPAAVAGIVGRSPSAQDPQLMEYRSLAISEDPNPSYQKLIADMIEIYRLNHEQRQKRIKELQEAMPTTAAKKPDEPGGIPVDGSGVHEVTG